MFRRSVAPSPRAVDSDLKAARLQTTFVATRACWGLFLIGVRPRWLRSVGLATHEANVLLVRVLGVRHLVQAGMQAIGRNRARRIGALVDLAHLLSMLLLGGLTARHRKPVLLDAALAAGFLGWGLALKRPDIRQPAHRMQPSRS